MDFWRSYDQSVEELVVLLILTIILASYNITTRGDCLSGALFTRQLLESPNRARIRSFIRMELSSFERLLAWLINNTNLRSSRHTEAAKKLVMFL